MSFVIDMSIYLEAEALKLAVLKLRPELARHVHDTKPGRPALSIDVAGQPVVVALTRGTAQGRPALQAWMIDGGFGDRSSFWFQGTPRGVLAQAIAARVDAAHSGQEPASPWRWDEASPSPLTELADALNEMGVAVTAVVAHNRCVSTIDGTELGLRLAPDAAGHFLEIVGDDREEALRVALHPKLGWTLDRTLPRHAARLDLGRLLTGTETCAPGVVSDGTRIEQLADAVFRVYTSDRTRDEVAWPSLNGTERVPRVYADGKVDVAQTAALWLRWFGFRDASPVEGQRGQLSVRASRASAEIRMSERPTDLAAVQRLAGVASVDGAQPVVFCCAGYTKTAVAWADKAGMALFLLEPDGSIQAANLSARHLLPPAPDWQRSLGGNAT